MRVALCSILLLTAACGGELGTNLVGAPPEGYVVRTSTGADTTEGYPKGPYGGSEGETLPNMAFSGFFTSDQVEGGVHQQDYLEGITLEGIRDVEGYTHLLLTVGAEWCKPCREEAITLRNLYPDWQARGGFILGVITQDKSYNAAGRSVVEAWSRRFQTPYSLVHDPEGYITTTLNPSTVPVNLVVDLRTMTVLRARVGEDADTFVFFESLLQPE